MLVAMLNLIKILGLDAKFFDLDKLPDLSFDHDIIIKDIKRRPEKDVL